MIVESNLVYNDTTIYLYDDLHITSGAKLTLRNVTLYFMGNESHMIIVDSKSELILNNSRIQPHENYTNRWIINMNTSLLQILDSELWGLGISRLLENQRGIYAFNSSIQITNTRFNDVYTALTLNSCESFIMNSSQFTNMGNLIDISNSKNILFGPNITGSTYTGVAIQLDNSLNVKIYGNRLFQPNSSTFTMSILNSKGVKIENNSLYAGIQASNVNNLLIKSNDIIDPNAGQEIDYGIILVNSSDALLQYNTIHGLEVGAAAVGGFSYSVSVQEGENISLKTNIFRSFRGWGIEIVNPLDLDIEDNQILRGSTLIFYENSFNEIGGGLGLYLSSSSGFENIINNTFQDLVIGIYFNNDTEKVNAGDYDNTFFYLNNWEADKNYVPSNLIDSINWYSLQENIGNYWEDYSGVDSDKDNIIDSPYYLSATISDHFPLLYPNYAPKITFNQSHTWFLANGINQSINWIIDDFDAVEYNVTENKILIQNNLLNDSRVIVTSISAIEGNYSYKCFILDTWGNSKSKTAQIEVEPPDYAAPILSIPNNITLDEYEPKKPFIWNCTEVHPERYDITLDDNFRDDELTKGEWNTTHFTFEIGNLAEKAFPSNYILNITLYDVLDNHSSYEIPVYVNDNGPVIIGDSELNGSQDSIVLVNWDVYDRELNLTHFYDIFRNGSIQETSKTSVTAWYTKDAALIGIRVTHQFNTSSSVIGLLDYNFTIVITEYYDFILNPSPKTNISTTIVHVLDTTPPQISPDPMNPTQIDEFGGIKTFNWNCSDPNPSAYNITIYSIENETTLIVYADHDSLQNNSWFGLNLTYYLNPLKFSIGDYRIRVSVTDVGSNTAYSPTRTFSIIDNTSILGPFNPPSNISVEYDTIDDVILSWNFTDRNPIRYRIFRNNTQIINEEWNGSLIELYNLSRYLWTRNTDLIDRLAYYELTIFVFDAGNNYVNHTVGVLVQDTIGPILSNPPSSLEILNHTFIGQSISYYVNETLPDRYYYSINAKLVVSEKFNQTITISYDYFNVGLSEVNFTLTDLAGNFEIYTYNMSLLDQLTPVLKTKESNRTLIYPNNRVALSWVIFDVRPSHYKVYLNEKLIENGTWKDHVYLVITFEIGTNIVYIEIFDTSNNFITDRVEISILDVNSPVIHHFSPSSRLKIFEGEDVEVYVIASDEDPFTYIVNVDDQLYLEGYWSSEVSVLIQNQPLGVHRVTFTLYDKSGNFNGVNFQIEVISHSTITSPFQPRFFGLDQRSTSFLIFLVSITLLIIGIRRLRRKIRERKSQ